MVVVDWEELDNESPHSSHSHRTFYDTFDAQAGPTVRTRAKRLAQTLSLTFAFCVLALLVLATPHLIPGLTESEDEHNSRLSSLWIPTISCTRPADYFLPRMKKGEIVHLICPPGCSSAGSVYGHGPFTIDSSVCASAVKRGILHSAKGGMVRLKYNGMAEVEPMTSMHNGQKYETFAFMLPPPIIKEVSPANGPTAGNPVITLKGTFFGLTDTTPTVTVGHVGCTSASWQSKTVLTCSMPPSNSFGSEAVGLTVLSQRTRSHRTVTYDAPLLSGATPLNGPSKGGVTLTMYGNNFGFRDTTPTARVGDTACAPSTWISSSSIGCVVSPGHGTKESISLDSRGVTTYPANGFDYTYKYDVCHNHTFVDAHQRTTWQRYCDPQCANFGNDFTPMTAKYHRIHFDPQKLSGAVLVLYITLDDHNFQSSRDYFMSATLNGHTVLHRARLDRVPHGSPGGGPFDNFVAFEIPLGAQDVARLVNDAYETRATFLPHVGPDNYVVMLKSELRLCY